jgi:hypothetical protein
MNFVMRTWTVSLAVAAALCGVASAEVSLKSSDARGRPVQLKDYRGKVVAVTFASKETRDESTEVNDELATLSDRDALVLSVVDMESIPHFGRKTAFKKIARSDRPGLQHVVDEHGEVAHSFGVDPRSQVAILIVDKNGGLRGRFDGLRELPQAQHLMEQLKQEPSAQGKAHRASDVATRPR